MSERSQRPAPFPKSLPVLLPELENLAATGPRAIVRCTSFAAYSSGVEFSLFAAVVSDGGAIIDRRAPRVPGPECEGDELALWVTDPEPRPVRIVRSDRWRMFCDDRVGHKVDLFFGMDWSRSVNDVVLHLRWQELQPIDVTVLLTRSSLETAASALKPVI